MKILYRICEFTNPRHAAQRTGQVKLPNATKARCLTNVMECFPNSEITVFVDAITDETWHWLKSLPRIQIKKIHEGSEAKSMRVLLNEAVAIEDLNEIVLFQEDDYLYLPGSEEKLVEALEYSEYATGYLHPDKFMHPGKGGNPYTLMDNVSELTRIIKTKSHFWMLTNSTTCTFATTVNVVRQDLDVWMWGTGDLINSKDYAIFLKLREKGRKLVQPLPSLCTHCLRGCDAPVVGLGISSWEEL